MTIADFLLYASLFLSGVIIGYTVASASADKRQRYQRALERSIQSQRHYRNQR